MIIWTSTSLVLCFTFIQLVILLHILFSFLPLVFKKYLFLIDWQLVYHIGLISVIHQHELTIGVHMSLPSWISLPPPAHSPSCQGYYIIPVWVPWVIQEIPIDYLLTYVSVYASMLLSPFISPSSSSPLPLSISLFSMSVSPLLLCT